MKKFIMMLVCMFAVHTMVMADNDFMPLHTSFWLSALPR